MKKIAKKILKCGIQFQRNEKQNRCFTFCSWKCFVDNNENISTLLLKTKFTRKKKLKTICSRYLTSKIILMTSLSQVSLNETFPNTLP